jgi:hypothetical protein
VAPFGRRAPFPGNDAARRRPAAQSPELSGEQLQIVTILSIGPRYFDTIDLLRGPAFTDAEGGPGHQSVIINQRLASMYFKNENPIDKRIRLTEETLPVRRTQR